MKKKYIILILIIFLLCGCGKNKFVGKWEQYVLLEEGTGNEREYYGFIELTEDYKCKYYGYNLNNKEEKKEINGIYIIRDGKAYCYYNKKDPVDSFFYELYINEDEDRLCHGSSNCEDYYTKSTSKKDNHIKLSEV